MAALLPPPTAALCSFFDQISQDTGKFVFGVKDTLACLVSITHAALLGCMQTLRVTWCCEAGAMPAYPAQQPQPLRLAAAPRCWPRRPG